jgi:hypothetical protein
MHFPAGGKNVPGVRRLPLFKLPRRRFGVLLTGALKDGFFSSG